MQLSIGNAPCSWGVEFASDPRNPPWERVLDEARAAGYRGMELGPVGFMPEEPAVLAAALAKRGLTLIGGVVFQPFHDPEKWEQVLDATVRTAKSLSAHGAPRIVLIDSIAPARAPFAGRGKEAPRFKGAELRAFHDRLRTAARIATEEYGLSATIHAHAGGYVDFEDEVEGLMEAVDPRLLGICLDTAHATYAGIDPVAFYRSHAGRIPYIHFKDIDPKVKAKAIAERMDYYKACGDGLFCKLGEGEVDFAAFRRALEDAGYSGWATVEQDCDPLRDPDTLADARFNLNYLKTAGLA